MPVVFCVYLRLHGFPLMQFVMFIAAILLQLRFGQLCWWGFMSVASDITSNLPDPLVLQVFPSPLPQNFLRRKCGIALYTYPIGLGFITEYWLVVICYSVLHLLQTEVSLIRGRDYTYLWVQRQIFINIYNIYKKYKYKTTDYVGLVS